MRSLLNYTKVCIRHQQKLCKCTTAVFYSLFFIKNFSSVWFVLMWLCKMTYVTALHCMCISSVISWQFLCSVCEVWRTWWVQAKAGQTSKVIMSFCRLSVFGQWGHYNEHITVLHQNPLCALRGQTSLWLSLFCQLITFGQRNSTQLRNRGREKDMQKCSLRKLEENITDKYFWPICQNEFCGQISIKCLSQQGWKYNKYVLCVCGPFTYKDRSELAQSLLLYSSV